MKKNYITIIILVIVIIIAIVVFAWYYIGSSTNSVATNVNLDLNTDLNVAAVASVNPAPGNGGNQGDSKKFVGKGDASDPGFVEALGIVNSFLSPNLTPAQANGTEYAQYMVWQDASGIYNTIDSSGLGSNMCHHPISITTAKWIQSRMNEHGINADYLTATTSQYVQIDSQEWASMAIGRIFGGPGISPDSAPAFGYCLDVGYVSNYPNYINKYTAFYNAHPNAYLGHLYKFGETAASVNLAARSGSTSSALQARFPEFPI